MILTQRSELAIIVVVLNIKIAGLAIVNIADIEVIKIESIEVQTGIIGKVEMGNK